MCWLDHSRVIRGAKAMLLAAQLWGTCFTALAQSEQLTPVALVTELSGRAETREGERTVRLSLLSELERGARVRLTKEAKLALLFYGSAEIYVVTGPALVRVGHASLEPLSGNEPTRLQRLAGKNGNSLMVRPGGVTQAGFVARGVAKPIVATTVTGTVILDQRPVFRWNAVAHGLAYRFSLKYAGDKTMLEAVVQDNAFELPGGVVLGDGQSYRWSVRTTTADGTEYAFIRNFVIADLAARAEVENFRPNQSASLSERVAYGVWLEQSGLLDEARRYWHQLAADGLSVPTEKLEEPR
jgi:hypothetical protein